MIKRGGYLVSYGGCNDCHTPKLFTPQGPKPGRNRLLSGHPSDAKLPDIPQGIVGPKIWRPHNKSSRAEVRTRAAGFQRKVQGQLQKGVSAFSHPRGRLCANRHSQNKGPLIQRCATA